MKTWTKTALFFFLIATLIGAMLRWVFVGGAPDWLNFKFFLHAHSHIAMLGWVFLALYSLFIFSFLNKEQRAARIYKILFGLQVISCLGMLAAFPVQGYAAVSISFSTLHIIISYVFARRFWKDLNQQYTTASPAVTFIKTALVFMIVSTLALWALGPVIANGLRGSALYYATVQFYLHFQFNGWFIFAVLGLFFKLLENQNISIPGKLVRPFYFLLLTSCVLTYALAVAWGNPLAFILWINSLGAFLQFLALFYFIILLKKLYPGIKKHIRGIPRLLIGISIACLVLKILIQSAVVVPVIAEVAYTVRNFVIGFMHLILLGVISIFILGYSNAVGLINLKSRLAKFGVYIFLIAFFVTELILFGQGLLLWGAVGFFQYYYESLFIFSALFPFSLLMILIGQRDNKSITA